MYYTKNDKQVTIYRDKLLLHLQNEGIFLDPSGQGKYVKVDHKIVRSVTSAEIRRDLLQSITDPEVREAFLQKHNFLTDKFFDFLEEFDKPFLRDTISEAFYPFQNVIVKVTKDTIELISFDSVEPYLREEQVGSKDYAEEDPFASVFYSFIQNIAGRTSENRNSDHVDTQKVKALMSLIGYMLINYKDKARAIAPILMDENSSDTAEGGRGKTLIAEAISKLRKTVSIDGRMIKNGDKFLYSDIDETVDVLSIDDLLPSFDLNITFPAITTGIQQEKKGIDKRFIPFEKSPKILFSTNYTVKGNGASYRRRKFEFGLSDYYDENFTPIDEFGKRFFDEWDEKEWNQFYALMFWCVQLYLREGLVDYDRSVLNRKKVIEETSQEFVDFADNNFSLNEENDKRTLCTQFMGENHLTKFSPHRFTKFLNAYAGFKQWKLVERQSNSRRLITFQVH